MESLRGHTAIVTGATRGIGRAIAVRLAAAGANVAVASRSSDGAPLARELAGGGVEAVAVRADVADPGAAREMVAFACAQLGPVDILVNNAGMADPDYRSAWELGPESWERMLAVNLSGVFHVCAAALPQMISLGWGRVVNISSTSGITGGTSGAHYAAAKGGVIAFSKALAAEVAAAGITVNVVAPSKIETEMFRRAVGPQERPRTLQRIPVGRFGRPEEVAEAVAYFAGPRAGYTTGQVLVVSGGY
jgi:2-hydroxycyclohexanecarboxyl-CoA dehydrogenase